MRDELDLKSLSEQGIRYRQRVRLSNRLRIAAVIGFILVSLGLPPPPAPPRFDLTLPPSPEFTRFDLIFVALLLGLTGVFAAAEYMVWQLNAAFRQQMPAFTAFLRGMFPQMPTPEAARKLPTYGNFPFSWKRVFLVLTLIVIAGLYFLHFYLWLSGNAVSLGGLIVVFWIIYALLHQMRPRFRRTGLYERIYNMIYVERDYTNAAAYITWIKKGSFSPRLFTFEPELFTAMGEYDRAETFYCRMLAIALTRGHEAQIIGLGSLIAVCRFDQGYEEDAIKLLEWLIQLTPVLPISYGTLADLYNRMPDSPSLSRPLALLDAIDRLGYKSLGSTRQISYYITRIQRAWALARLGRRKEAEAILVPLVQSKVNFPHDYALPIYRSTAAAFAAMGDWAYARALYTQIHNIDPNGAAGREAAEHLARLNG